MADNPIVYIVDDDEAVRDSLGLMLVSAGYRVRGFASARELLDVWAGLPLGCLVIDVRMPEMDGLELQGRLAQLKARFPVIMMTGHGDVPMAVRAMRAGAVDFVEKPFPEESILESLRMAQQRLDPGGPGEDVAAAAAARVALLSPREREVLEGLFAGLPNKTIAADLAISPRTVEIHRARVMDKMQARSLSELVRLALAAGVRIDD